MGTDGSAGFDPSAHGRTSCSNSSASSSSTSALMRHTTASSRRPWRQVIDHVWAALNLVGCCPPPAPRQPLRRVPFTPAPADGRVLHTGSYPPGWSRLRCYEASNTGSLALRLLASPNEPTPSGSSGAARLRRGRLPPSPPLPRITLPPGFTKPLRRPGGDGSPTTSRSISATWRTAPARRNPPRP